MAEIKYTILNDDGDNFEYEKAIVENKSGARSKIEQYRARIEAIRANMKLEEEEIAEITKEIEELEEVAKLADEKKAEEEAQQENEVVGE